MKKLHRWIGVGIMLLPAIVMATTPSGGNQAGGTTGTDGLTEGINMVAQTGELFGTIIVVVAVSLWLLPIAFAALVYTGQKKKAEQMHEEVGLKAAIMALLAGVLGAAMAFYVVGTIGKYAADNAGGNLSEENRFLLKAVIGSGVTQIKK